jgi:hypothetical protein
VVELFRVLMELGLKEERVTSEIYFNYQEHSDPLKIRALAANFSL